MPYRVALIDVDDTLLDFAKAEHHALQEAFAAFGEPFDGSTAKLYHQINDALWKRLEKGEVDRDGLWKLRFTQLFEQLGRAEPAGINAVYMESLATQAFPIDGAEDMLRQAAELMPLYVVTNGVGKVQRQRLGKTGLDRYFKGLFVSHEMGAQKPSPAYFDMVFARLGEPLRGQSILLGDSLTSDMKGARAAGITACWYCPDEKRPDVPGAYDFRIAQLAQFIDILKGER